jgi:dihydrodipicolinate synthase/N-acetylneuraminate lyase
MQLGSDVHALEHVGEALKHSPKHSWTVSGDELCATCALFAGGATAIAGTVDVAPVKPATCFERRSASSLIAAAAPSYYSSRAPPVPL